MEVYAKSLKTFLQYRFPDIDEIKIFRIGEMCLMEMERNPVIVIMDYFLNSKYEEAYNGLEIIKRIKVQKPRTHIVVLSVQQNFNIILESIKQYNCIYIQKDEDAFTKIEQFISEIINSESAPAYELWN